MFELICVILIPVIGIYSWYMGYKTAKREQEEANNKFNMDYAEGLNFLLSNQQEKAVDLFLQILQRSSNDHFNDKFNAKLTLGNLFRSRGDFNQAIKIHRQLRIDPNSSYDQKLLASAQMALDFINIGIYDRAEKIYLSLQEEPDFKQLSLENLCIIYERIKDWTQAIIICEKLLKIQTSSDKLDKYKIKLANYYCESILALNDTSKNPITYSNIFNKAPNSIRAALLLADELLEQKNYKQALVIYEQFLSQHPKYIGEIIFQLQQCYIKLSKINDFYVFLSQNYQSIQNKKFELAMILFFESNLSKSEFDIMLNKLLVDRPSIYIFYKYLLLQIEKIETVSLKNNLTLLSDIISNTLSKEYAYSCNKCGYASNNLAWFCKACREWESYEPNYFYQ